MQLVAHTCSDVNIVIVITRQSASADKSSVQALLHVRVEWSILDCIAAAKRTFPTSGCCS